MNVEDLEPNTHVPPVHFGERLKLELSVENGTQQEMPLYSTSTANPLIIENEDTNGLKPLFDRESVINNRITSIFCSNLGFSLDWIKSWSIASYKCTRQRVQEQLNKLQKGVDVELEETVDALADVQRRYENLLCLILQHVTALTNYIQSQQQFSCFLHNLMEQDEYALKDLYQMNVDAGLTMPSLIGLFLVALDHVAGSLKTLVEVAFMDTLSTLDRYESSRAEFDIRVRNLEALKSNKAEIEIASTAIEQMSAEVDSCRLKYENLRADFQTKIKLLQENKVKVVRRNLNLFIEAAKAFYSGDKESLLTTLSTYHVPIPKSQLPVL